MIVLFLLFFFPGFVDQFFKVDVVLLSRLLFLLPNFLPLGRLALLLAVEPSHRGATLLVKDRHAVQVAQAVDLSDHASPEVGDLTRESVLLAFEHRKICHRSEDLWQNGRIVKIIAAHVQRVDRWAFEQVLDCIDRTDVLAAEIVVRKIQNLQFNTILQAFYLTDEILGKVQVGQIDQGL